MGAVTRVVGQAHSSAFADDFAMFSNEFVPLKEGDHQLDAVAAMARAPSFPEVRYGGPTAIADLFGRGARPANLR